MTELRRRTLTEPASEFLELFRDCERPTAKHDTYFAIYDELFAPYKGKDITFVEIGILGGGSLEVWKKFFGSGSRIIGIDLNPALRDELAKDGFEVHIGDQADPAFWRDFYAKVGKIDVLLDDGGHTNAQMWTTFLATLEHVNDGGLVVTEDTHASFMRGFGNPSDESYISRLMACVAAIGYRSSSIDDLDRRAGLFTRTSKLLRGSKITSLVHSIRFYESIVAVSIDSRKCRRSQTTEFGTGGYPEDFRYRGIRDGLRERVKRRVRAALRRLPI